MKKACESYACCWYSAKGKISDALLHLLFIITVILGLNISSVHAEGSRTLYPNGYAGSRADLDLEASEGRYVGKVRRSGFLYVYAQAGEYIVLGSRNRSNGGDINVYNPQDFGVPGDENYNALTPGTPDFTCSGGSTQPGTHYSGGTRGTIANRNQELAGPKSADGTLPAVGNTFIPCAYQAPVTGSYGVLFFAAPGGINPPDGNIATPAIDAVGVSAWDVTVRSSTSTSTTDINGRLYTYAFIGFTGANLRPIYYTVYYVTRDGYRYQQDMNGLDPNGYATYANSLGFLDYGQPLYKDLRGQEYMVTTLPMGATTQTAEYPLFFSDVTPSGSNAAEVNRVLSSLNIPLVPPSPTVSNVQFVGNVSGSTSYLGTGGTFTFDTTDTMTYQIVISLDGIDFDPANTSNRTLTGLAPSGSNTVVWDGKDNANANFPAGGPYPFRVSGRNGEVHFPMIDAENNYYGGPHITRLNGAGSPDTTVYYDDRGYIMSSGLVVGTLNGILCSAATPAEPNPEYSLDGIDSSTAYRTWGVNIAPVNASNTDCRVLDNAWGDTKAVNLWTYYSYTPTDKTLAIIAVNVDAATTVTGATTATAGSTVQGTFTFANNGTGTANGITYAMNLSPGLGTVTFGNLPTGTTATYNNGTGVVTFGGTPLPTTLTAGQKVFGATPANPMTYSYTVPASGSVTVTTGISTTSTDGVPANNNASVTTYIGTTDVMTIISVLEIASPGGLVPGNILFTNNGSIAALGVTYAATIGSGSYFPPAVAFTQLPSGVIADYNNTTGVVTFYGLPATLASSQIFNIGFSYIAPASGLIPVTSSVTTTSTDANPANNNSNANTFVGPDLTVAKNHTGNFYQGQTGAQYTITASNSGTLSTNGTVTVTDTLPAGLTATAISGTGWTCVLGTQTCTRSDVLAAGASYPVITLTVNVAAGAGSPLVNNVTVSGGGENNTTNDTAADSTTVTTPPTLTVAKSHTGNFYRNQTGAQYTITVSNVGGAATDGTTVTVADTLWANITATAISGTGWTCVLGTRTCTRSDVLAAGASYPDITLAVNVGAAANTGTNTVTVIGGGDASLNTATDPTTVSVTASDLTVTKTHVGNFTQGQNGAQYTITPRNIGTANATLNITITDTLPTGLTYVSGTGTGWACGAVGQVVTCTTGSNINAGAVGNPITLTVNVSANATTPLVNIASVSGGNQTYTSNDTASDSTIVNQLRNLTVAKSHTGNFYRNQTGALYTITVSNIGGAATDGTTVTVADTLWANITATAISGTGWTCVLGTRTCTRSDVLAAGASYPVITLTVNVGAAANTGTNTVTVIGGGDATLNTATDPTTVSITASDLTVTKTHVGNFTQGQNGAQYTITPRNIGTANATANITITDTLPTGLTYVSGTGTNWNCTAVAQVVTCTTTSDVNAGAFGNPITLTVNVSANATTPLVNVASVSGGNQTYTSNDTASDSTIVNQLPDLTVTKTHSGSFQQGDTGQQYTITVSNIGSGAKLAGNTVTVTDTLPSDLTATAISGTNWTCVLGTLTCTRTDALSAGSSYPDITLTVDVAGDAEPSLTNIASVSLAGQSEMVTTNNSAYDTVTIFYIPTRVTLFDFRAYEKNGEVIVKWETASELDTLGFNLLRLDSLTGKYEQVNSDLLPAMHRPHRGGKYTFKDTGASPGKTYTYKLIEVEIFGRQLSYGPFTVSVEKNTVLSKQNTMARGTVPSLASNYTREQRDHPQLNKVLMEGKTARKPGKGWEVAIGERIKITVTDNGIYYIAAQNISSLMGISLEKVSSLIGLGNLSLSNKGKQVAYLPADNNAGLYFYGTRIDSLYTKENIYWLDKGKGAFMTVRQHAGPEPSSVETSFTETMHIEEDAVSWETLFDDPDADYWFWDQIYASKSYTDPPRTFTFQAPGLAIPQTTATLRANLFGASDAGVANDHHIVISLNGQSAESWWSGLTPHTFTTTFSLNPGENTLTVQGKADKGVSSSFVLIDSFDVTYQRLYEADGDRLFFSGDGNQPITLGGFSSPDIMVFDLTNPLRPVLDAATSISAESGSYTVSLNPVSAKTPYLAIAEDGVKAAPVKAAASPSLSLTNNAADYIVIAPAELVTTAQGLAAYRSSQGMKTMVVNLEDIMNEFNYGISSPEAIRSFLSVAYLKWKKAPRYVVLAGDGSMDYKDNLKFGGSLIPSKMVPTDFGLAMSDNYLADVNGDHLPEIAIGRLPVVSPGELQTVIDKIKTYERNLRSTTAVLMADTPDDGGDFIADSEAVAGLFTPAYTVKKIYLTDPDMADAKRVDLISAINKGAAFFNYVGHAGPDQLSNWGLLSYYPYPEYDPPADDLSLLTNSKVLPVMTAMTCGIANFSDPYQDVLGEALLLKPDGGMAATWSATGLSDDAQANILNREFYKSVFSVKKAVLGDAVLKALSVYNKQGTMPFMMDIYCILGDPALRIR